MTHREGRLDAWLTGRFLAPACSRSKSSRCCFRHSPPPYSTTFPSFPMAGPAGSDLDMKVKRRLWSHISRGIRQ